MARVPTRDRSGSSVELKPLGQGGLNLNDHPAMLDPSQMRWAANIDRTQDTYARRWGDAKVFKFADTGLSHGAKVFGSDTKYASFTPPLIPIGSWTLAWHFTAVRPSSGATTRYLWSSWTSHANFNSIGAVWATIGDTGNFTVLVNWEGGSSVATSLVALALTADAEYHALLVYDEPAGTLSLYLNGELADVETVGSGLQPRQDAGVAWYVGVSYDPGVGVDSGRSFQGAFCSFTLHSYVGVDLTDEDTEARPPRKSILAERRARSWQDWPNPAGTDVLFHYAFDEETAGTGSLYDYSDAQRHGTYHGSPTNADRVAIRACNGQFIGTTRRANVGVLSDGRVNIVVAGGQTYYETLRVGA